jgi:hypothetical protein
MSRTVIRLFAMLALLVSMDGLAAAQVVRFGSQVAGGWAGAATASSSPVAAPAAEPRDLAGMLAAQNDARARVGVAALTWSAELAEKAQATAKKTSTGSGACTPSTVDRVGRAEKASMYWAPGLRRATGGDTVQEISATYLVSRWREGRNDYDMSNGLCRTNSNSCEPYSRMVAPKARKVGCARLLCPSQAQVWACHYSE